MIRHFLRDDDLTPQEQAEVLELAVRLRHNRFGEQPLSGPRAVAVLFDKPTLRTQVSFSAGIAELGGHPLVVDARLAQIGVRESIADTARVLEQTPWTHCVDPMEGIILHEASAGRMSEDIQPKDIEQ